MLSNEKIAALVAKQMSADYGIQVGVLPFDEHRGRGRDAEEYFSLDVTQDLGVFKPVMSKVWIKVRAGDVVDNGQKQTCVFVGLHYDHTHGGSNGANIGTYWYDQDGKLVGSREG